MMCKKLRLEDIIHVACLTRTFEASNYLNINFEMFFVHVAAVRKGFCNDQKELVQKARPVSMFYIRWTAQMDR